ncbi:MAG: hypothetical protein IT371_30600 [Deltaproteobacteria bacterium]|nr:hypothetical protein [Deltaproteobacteria bacterium]
MAKRRRRGRNPKMTKALAAKAKRKAAAEGISYQKAMGILMRGGSASAPKRKKKKASRRAAPKRKKKKASRRAPKRAKKKAGRRGGRRGARRSRKAYRPYVGSSGKFSKRVKENLVKRKAARRGKRGGYMMNPRRRRRKNPYRPMVGKGGRFSKRVKRRMAERGLARGSRLNPRRRRRNPISLAGVRSGIRSLLSRQGAMKYSRIAVGALAGMAVARQAPGLFSRIPVVGQYLRADTPLKSILLSIAAIGLGTMAARRLKLGNDIVASMVAGGAGVVGAGVLKLASSRIPALKAIPGVSGMGDVVSPSQLVAGEAIFGGSGVGDYLQLGGPVPEQYFAGGMNDYVDFVSPAAGRAAEAASFAQVDWSPGTETSF